MTEANRECRDVICCIIFFINIVAMIYLTFYGYLNGNPTFIYRGTASNAICGQSAGAEDFPYMYLYNPIPFSGSVDTDKRVCVETCPTITNGTLSQLNCFPVPSGGCTYTVTFNNMGTPNMIPSASDFLGYPSTAQLGRVCIPTAAVFSTGFSNIVASSSATISSVLRQGYLADFITDVENNWMWLLAGMGIAVVISFMYMFLLRCFVGCIVWGSIIGIFVLLIGLGIVFLYNGGAIASTVDSIGFLGIPELESS